MNFLKLVAAKKTAAKKEEEKEEQHKKYYGKLESLCPAFRSFFFSLIPNTHFSSAIFICFLTKLNGEKIE